MSVIREAKESDLKGLLLLYTQLHDNSIPEETRTLNDLWHEIINDRNHHIIVALENNKIISSCVAVIIPNLTHNQRPYCLVENVITDKAYRKKGFAGSCLDFAKQIAIKENCYKIMLLTGSKEESTLGFYKNSGYNSNDKTAFIQWL